MPIQVSCQCGKQGRVPDEYAGKKIKCSACGSFMAVPRAGKAEPAKKPSAPAAKPALIKFPCPECDKPMQAKAEFAGRKVKCPSCQSAVAIPNPEEEVEPEEEMEEEESPRARIQTGKSPAGKGAKPPAKEEDEEGVEEDREEADEDEDEQPRKKKSRRDADEEEEDEEDEERPRKKSRRDEEEDEDEDEEDDRPKKKSKKGKKGSESKTGLVIGLSVGGALVLVGVVVGAIFLFGGKSQPPAGSGNQGPAAGGTTPNPVDHQKSINNLKQFGLASMNYALGNNNRLPGNYLSPTGQPLLSWRVALLDYMEQGILYRQFKLDEPWDSPNNIKLLDKMPKLYTVPGTSPSGGKTHYQLFTGPKTLYEGKDPPVLPASFNKKGTSNLLMIVEAAQPVEWTKPADIPFNPQGNPMTLLRFTDGACPVVFCDGRTTKLRQNIDPQNLKNAILANEGEAFQEK